MKTGTQVVSILLFIVITGCLTPALAQSLSEGCAHKASLDAIGPTKGILDIVRPYAAGEQVQVVIDDPSSGSPVTSHLQVDGSDVDTGGFPATLSYMFTADGSYKVDVFIESGDSPKATFTYTCGIPSAEPVALPIGGRIFGLLAILGILGIGFRYARRV